MKRAFLLICLAIVLVVASSASASKPPSPKTICGYCDGNSGPPACNYGTFGWTYVDANHGLYQCTLNQYGDFAWVYIGQNP